MVSAHFASSTTVPVTSSGYVAGGDTIELALDFTPVPGVTLTVVDNTGLGFIDGTFDNLVNGQSVTFSHGGQDYAFVAWYYGGTGNDLVLLWKITGLAGWGSNGNYQNAVNQAGNIKVPTASDLSGVIAGKTIVQVVRGQSHSLALTSEGKVDSCGNSSNGQMGINSQFGDFAPR